METAVPTLSTVGTGERDVLPVVCPTHLVSFILHELDEALPVINILQRLIDGVDQIQLPAIAPQTGLVLTGPHLLFAGTLRRRLQHTETVGDTDLVVDLPVLLEVVSVLVQLAAVDTVDAVDDITLTIALAVCFLFFTAVKVAIISPPC